MRFYDVTSWSYVNLDDPLRLGEHAICRRKTLTSAARNQMIDPVQLFGVNSGASTDSGRIEVHGGLGTRVGLRNGREPYGTGTEPYWIASLIDDYSAYVRLWRAVNIEWHTQAFVN